MTGDIFKAYDVRGKVGTELTVEVAEQIGRAFADWLPEQGSVAVGRDMRPDSEQLSSALIAGLVAQGRNVVNIGEVTSDMIYFAVGQYGHAGGVMVTASHNPGEYNGIKFCADEAKPVGLETGLDKVRDLALAGSFKDAAETGTIETADVRDAWIDHVLSFVEVENLRGSKIAIDAGNGMAGAIIPSLEKHVPWKIIPMYFELDGTFPNHPANPLDPANLRDLQLMVEQEECDLGIAFDGDGDRAALIDEKGGIVSGGVMSAILAEYFLHKFPDSNIVYDVRNSKIVPETIEANGGHAVRQKVGHSPLKAEMRRVNAPFGGEASGHFYFRDNWFADSGLIAAVIAVAIYNSGDKKLSELADEYRKYVAIPETNFEVEDKDAAIKRIAEAFENGEQDWLDGLTVTYPDAWFNVRPSNTEPLLRINVEAGNSNRLNGLVTKLSELITQS